MDSNIINDDDHLLINDPKVNQSWKNGVPAGASVYETQIFDILLETYAGHYPSSDKNAEVSNFLGAHLT